MRPKLTATSSCLPGSPDPFATCVPLARGGGWWGTLRYTCAGTLGARPWERIPPPGWAQGGSSVPGLSTQGVVLGAGH